MPLLCCYIFTYLFNANMSLSEQPTAQPLLAADGVPLKRSLSRALRAQKLRALMLIAPLLGFVLLTFIMPIGAMLFRSVENEIVSTTLPYTVTEIAAWQPQGTALPEEAVFRAAYFDLFVAAKAKEHTKLGTRLNYEQTGVSSTFRKSGRALDDAGKDYAKQLAEIDPAWKKKQIFLDLFFDRNAKADTQLARSQQLRLEQLKGQHYSQNLTLHLSSRAAAVLPLTAREIAFWAVFMAQEKNKDTGKAKLWESVYVALIDDLQNPDLFGAIDSFKGPHADILRAAAQAVRTWPKINYQQLMGDVDRNWGEAEVWQTIKLHAPAYTSGYFLNAVDMRKTLDGPAAQPESKQILIKLFQRTVKMSLIITVSCILLAYPIAYLLANLPMRISNLLMILVLLPFWTSLLVRTSAWKVMLQQQGVINEVLVWLGLVADDSRLEIINNQFGTVIAMTHILLPFMILPMYSVMQTIPPSYVRAAKSLGATNWTAFWRVYFPQSVPGIGAGSILVFILAIGYYITPEIVGGTEGVFISNRIAYHISSSLNWGLAAALGAILLAVVLVLYWAYDKIVGIDNVKLG